MAALLDNYLSSSRSMFLNTHMCVFRDILHGAYVFACTFMHVLYIYKCECFLRVCVCVFSAEGTKLSDEGRAG